MGWCWDLGGRKKEVLALSDEGVSAVVSPFMGIGAHRCKGESAVFVSCEAGVSLEMASKSIAIIPGRCTRLRIHGHITWDDLGGESK